MAYINEIPGHIALIFVSCNTALTRVPFPGIPFIAIQCYIIICVTMKPLVAMHY